MKKYFLGLAMALFALAGFTAGDGLLITLVWTYDNPEVRRIYQYDQSGNVVGGPTMITNWPDSFILRGTNEAGSKLGSWPVVIAFPAMANGQVVTNLTMPMNPNGSMFFTLTASNSAGESYYSNVAFNTNSPNNPNALKAKRQ